MQFSKAQMIAALDALIARGKDIRASFQRVPVPFNGDFVAWFTECLSTLEAIYGTNSDAINSFRVILFAPPVLGVYPNETERQRAAWVWFDNGLWYAINSLIGRRTSLQRLLPEEVSRANQNVFISHGGPTQTHVDLVVALLEAVGLVPVVVMNRPNLGMSVNEKVHHYMRLCDSAVVLATEEDETTVHEGRARPNVENEVGMLQALPRINGRIVYMKEPGVKLASNYQEKAWIPFTKIRIQDAFVPLLVELREFGVLG
jgi:hypothetical protein